MVLGSDLLTVRFKTPHATDEVASVHLRDVSKPMSHAEALDLYLDAKLGGATALALCLHNGGKMVGYDLVKTEDVLSLSRGSGSDVNLSAKDVEVGALSLLRFLQDSCVRDGSYLLYRSGGDDTTLRLFDLSGSTLTPGKLELMASSASNATTSTRAPADSADDAASAASALLKDALATPEAWAVNLATIALEYAQVVQGKARALQQHETLLATKVETPEGLSKSASSQRIHLLLLRRRLLQESIDIISTQDKNATFVDRFNSRKSALSRSSSATKYSQLLCALHCQIASAYLSIADELELDTTDVPPSVFEGVNTGGGDSSSGEKQSLRDAKRIHILTALNEAAKNLVLSIRLNRLQNEAVMEEFTSNISSTSPSLYPDEDTLFVDLSSAAHRIVSLLLSEHEPVNRAAAPLQDAELALTVIEDILRLHDERQNSIADFPSIASALVASMLGNTVYWISRIFLAASSSSSQNHIVSDSLVTGANTLSFQGKPHSQAFVMQLHDQCIRDNKAINSLSSQLSLEATLFDLAMGKLCGSFTTSIQLSHACLLLFDASSLMCRRSAANDKGTLRLNEGSLTYNLLRETKRRLGSELVSAGSSHVTSASLPAAIACFSRAVDVFDDAHDLSNKAIAMCNVSSVLRTLGASSIRNNTMTVIEGEGSDRERDESCQFSLYRDTSSLDNAFKNDQVDHSIEPAHPLEDESNAVLAKPTAITQDINETIVSVSMSPQSGTLLQKALDVAMDAIRTAKEARREAKGDPQAKEAATAAFEMALHGTSQSALVFGAILSQDMRIVNSSSSSSFDSARKSPAFNDYALALFSVASRAISQSGISSLLKPLASIKLQSSLHLTRLTRLLHQKWPHSESFATTRSLTLSALADAANAFLNCSEPIDKALSCHCYVESTKLLCELKCHEEEDEDQIFSRLKLAVGKILSCAAPLSTLDVIKNKKDSSEITESVLQAASIAIRQILSALRKSKRDQSDLVKRCTALYSECLRLIGASSHPASRTVSLVLSRIKAEEWLYK